MIGRKMWISPTGGTATAECALHSEGKLLAAHYEPGRFMTEAELEQLIRTAFERGQEVGLNVCLWEWDKASDEETRERLTSTDDIVKELLK